MRPLPAILTWCLSIGLTACSPHPSSELKCGSASLLDVETSIQLQPWHAQQIAELAREVRLRIQKSSSATGFTGQIMGRIGGTSAHDIGFKLGRLRELVARQVAREQALRNNGQVLVPMEQSWACEMLADSVVSLDPVQGKQQLMEALEEIEQRFGGR
ncbi:MAG: hypothetical protein MN733_27345 [Nitrososphaera sp.]|nr:hypothetical protein [Nitrososphaera sp.]